VQAYDGFFSPVVQIYCLGSNFHCYWGFLHLPCVMGVVGWIGWVEVLDYQRSFAGGELSGCFSSATKFFLYFIGRRRCWWFDYGFCRLNFFFVSCFFLVAFPWRLVLHLFSHRRL
jgi:hypothetical protein